MPIYYLVFVILWSTPGYTTPSSSSTALKNGKINHTRLLLSGISSLYLSKDFSDVDLVVDGEEMRAHRFLLALYCEYFRVLFYGGLKETFDKAVELKEIPVASFKILLKYIYTSRLDLEEFEVKDIFKLLKISDYFGTTNLKHSLLEYIQISIKPHNVSSFLELARLYEYEDLEAKSISFIENNSLELMRDGELQYFPFEILREILNRDTFYAKEINIFHAVCRWIIENHNGLDRDIKIEVLTTVRYSLMSDKELSEAKESRLVSSDIILEAIQLRTSLSPYKPQYRGQLKPNVDLLSNVWQFPVNGRDDRGANMMKLQIPSYINYIEINVWYDTGETHDPLRSYSYNVDVSMDGDNWTRIIDRSNYNCRNYQHLWFHLQIVSYIRIFGTNSTANATFNINSVCYDTRNRHKMEIDNGLIVPKAEYNVATNNRAIVIKGEHSVRDQTFLNYFYENKDRYAIYTYHLLRSGAIVIHLAQPYILSSMRLLLWGRDKQAYGYTVEASTNGQKWEMIIDKSMKLARSWQVLKFKRMPILYIRITGVYSSSDNEFRCVYFEAPSRVISDSNVVEENQVGYYVRDTTMLESSSQTRVVKAKYRH